MKQITSEWQVFSTYEEEIAKLRAENERLKREVQDRTNAKGSGEDE